MNDHLACIRDYSRTKNKWTGLDLADSEAGRETYKEALLKKKKKNEKTYSSQKKKRK